MLFDLKKIAVLGGAALAGMLAVAVGDREASAQFLDQLLGGGSAEPKVERQVPSSREVVQYSFSPIVRRAAPAVVNVYVQRRVQTFSSPFANDPFFRQFFGDAFGQPSERIQSSLGSGVIVSPDGIVVTNTHVIRGRGEAEIRVALADKREFDARVISQDDKTDITVLKIDAGDQTFPTLDFEDSDSLEVGDMVLAIGNPFGVGQTVTSGIVSALARTEVGRHEGQIFIQTDAAINPGNSGGALVDMSGKLVGINTMIFSQSGGSQGIGFAIPSNLVRLYVEGAVEGRKIERPWLGARLETVTRDMADALGLSRVAGAVVARVSDRGPAAEAGLEAGDVIVHVDGFEVADARAVQYRLTTRGVGSTVRLDVIRKGQPQTIELPLVAAPEPGRDDVRNLVGRHPLDGARVSNILPGVADELGIDEIAGVVVVSVRRGSTAARLGFQPGDVIVEIGQAPVASVSDLETLLAGRQRLWSVAVRRADKVFNLQVPG
ncbi:MAG TPA: Do family serine endopeptidase [Hyphomicrobium sp.]|nr:Do family serine endopeptidase [Hyphomicrobium sp.]